MLLVYAIQRVVVILYDTIRGMHTIRYMTVRWYSIVFSKD